jgi:hypothetical protein
VRQASGNLQNVHVALPNGLSVVDLLQADYVIFARDALHPVTSLLLGEAPGDPAVTETPVATPKAPAARAGRASTVQTPASQAPAAETPAAVAPAAETPAPEAPEAGVPAAQGEEDKDA